MRKLRKKLTAVVTAVCMITVMAVPVLAAKTTVDIGNVRYTLNASKTAESASYYTIKGSVSGKIISSNYTGVLEAKSITCQALWYDSGKKTYVEGKKVSKNNVSSNSVTDSRGPKQTFTKANVTFVIVKDGTTKQRTVSAF